MDEIKRKRAGWSGAGGRRRLCAALSALWLVVFCLAGCVPPGVGKEAGTQPSVRQQETHLESEVSEQETQFGKGVETDQAAESESGKGTEADQAQAEGADGAHLRESGPGKGAEEEKPQETGTGRAAGREQPAQEESETAEPEPAEELQAGLTVEESGTYTSKEEVALYIHLYGHLPDNYITKKQAEKLGWDSKAGNLWDVAPGMSIGGSRFGNYEGALPDSEGRTYYECDIDYEGGYRGAKRIIYSNDGLIFYTEDHYKTFEEMYGQ